MKERIKILWNHKKTVVWITAAVAVVFAAVAVYFRISPAHGAKENGMQAESPVVIGWFDYSEDREIVLPEFPGVTFRASRAKVEAVTEEGVTELIGGMLILNTGFTDLDGDGIPEICATVSFGSGIVDEHIVVYDYINGETYTLWERGEYDYVLKMEEGKLVVWKSECMSWYDEKHLVKGTLRLVDDGDGIRRLEMTDIVEVGAENVVETPVVINVVK